MPHVPVAAVSASGLNDIASRRWAAIEQDRPDLEPALALQRRLLGLVIGVSESIAATKLPRLSLPAKYIAAKLSRGVPALTGEPIPLPAQSLTPLLLQLCEALAAGGAGEAAQHIHDIITVGKLDPN